MWIRWIRIRIRIGIRSTGWENLILILIILVRLCGTVLDQEMAGERTRLVESVWTLLTDKRVPLTVLHYNALLRVHLENKHRYLSPIEDKRGGQC
jgi:hypothetical protein